MFPKKLILLLILIYIIPIPLFSDSLSKKPAVRINIRPGIGVCNFNFDSYTGNTMSSHSGPILSTKANYNSRVTAYSFISPELSMDFFLKKNFFLGIGITFNYFKFSTGNITDDHYTYKNYYSGPYSSTLDSSVAILQSSEIFSDEISLAQRGAFVYFGQQYSANKWSYQWEISAERLRLIYVGVQRTYVTSEKNSHFEMSNLGGGEYIGGSLGVSATFHINRSLAVNAGLKYRYFYNILYGEYLTTYAEGNDCTFKLGNINQVNLNIGITLSL
jgi:hypothetical protein